MIAEQRDKASARDKDAPEVYGKNEKATSVDTKEKLANNGSRADVGVSLIQTVANNGCVVVGT
jgi:hypothetical protein